MNAVAKAVVSNINSVDAKPLSLTNVINQMVEGEKLGIRRRRNVAKGFNFQFPSIAWFDVQNGDQSSDGKAVLGYKKSIYDALKEIKHSNPSKVWADICAYGREELGLQPKPKAVKPASVKLVKALQTALKIVQGMESPSEAETDVGLDLIRSLAKLGVDTAE
jgi:hypothetical protein